MSFTGFLCVFKNQNSTWQWSNFQFSLPIKLYKSFKRFIKLIGIALYFSFKQMEKKSIAYKKEAQVPEFIFPPLIKNIPYHKNISRIACRCWYLIDLQSKTFSVVQKMEAWFRKKSPLSTCKKMQLYKFKKSKSP